MTRVIGNNYIHGRVTSCWGKRWSSQIKQDKRKHRCVIKIAYGNVQIIIFYLLSFASFVNETTTGSDAAEKTKKTVISLCTKGGNEQVR